MKFSEIREFPTTIDTGTNVVHESVLRSYHVLSKVVELLERGAGADTVIEVIEDLRSAPNTTG